jgi:hypothetical protein
MTRMPYDPYLKRDELLKFRQDLFRDLRTELSQLKICQNQAIIFGITGAGIMLGLIKELDNFREYLCLIPLFILLPFWLIYFDKARTIARIAGFIRVQERLALNKSLEGAVGWETSMKLYWAKENDWNTKEVKTKIHDFNNLSKNPKRNSIIYSTYWGTTYLVYYSISVICLILSLLTFIRSTNNFNVLGLAFPYFLSTIIILIGYSKSQYFQEGYIEFFYLCIISVLGSFIFSAILNAFLNNIIENFFPNFLSFYLSIFCNSDLFSSLHLIYLLIFTLILMIFIIVSMMAYWLLSNLMGGRYTYTAFEYRWWIIFDLPPEDFRTEGGIITRSVEYPNFL